MSIEPNEAMEAARAVAGDAAALLANASSKIEEVKHKANTRDLVTEWDTRSEDLIRERLGSLTPGIPLLAEESSSAGDIAARAGYRWVVDPLDGTVNFVHGLPIFSVSIALENDGEAVAGAVYAPALGWHFYGCAGGGAFMNGQPMAVSQIALLDSALLVSGFPYDRATNPDNNTAEWERFLRKAGGCRRLGSAALDLCYVARGWLDGYWERGLNAWDVSAGALFVREAGGRVTAPDGGPFVSATGSLLATNGAIHQQMLDELISVRRERQP